MEEELGTEEELNTTTTHISMDDSRLDRVKLYCLNEQGQWDDLVRESFYF